MLPERGLGGGGSLFAPECRDRDQTAQQHVHVQGQFGHEAHLSGLQVTHSAEYVMVFIVCKLKTVCIFLNFVDSAGLFGSHRWNYPQHGSHIINTAC